MTLWRTIEFSKVTQAGRCAACKVVFDPDLEQGGNIDIVVRRNPLYPAGSAHRGLGRDIPDLQEEHRASCHQTSIRTFVSMACTRSPRQRGERS
jgi:hypothetical protein